MFEMFRKKRAYRELANRIGHEIHRQLRQALTENMTIHWTAGQIAFTASYLKSFTFVGFSEIGNPDNEIQMKYIKYFCNGVLPNRLWDIFQKGEALNELSKNKVRKEFKESQEAYALGVTAGIKDGSEFFGHGVQPKKFEYFLTTGSVERGLYL